MIPLPPSTRIYLACGATDMGKGFDGLAVLAQQVLGQSPHSGALFAFRGKRGDLVKLLFDGQILESGLKETESLATQRVGHYVDQPVKLRIFICANPVEHPFRKFACVQLPKASTDQTWSSAALVLNDSF